FIANHAKSEPKQTTDVSAKQRPSLHTLRREPTRRNKVLWPLRRVARRLRNRVVSAATCRGAVLWMRCDLPFRHKVLRTLRPHVVIGRSPTLSNGRGNSPCAFFIFSYRRAARFSVPYSALTRSTN